MAFEAAVDAQALPDELVLYSEKTGRAARQADVQQQARQADVKQGLKVSLNVSELERGVYFLHVKNPRRKGKEIDALRILLQ